jgi:sulfatase modifying factor 1
MHIQTTKRLVGAGVLSAALLSCNTDDGKYRYVPGRDRLPSFSAQKPGPDNLPHASGTVPPYRPPSTAATSANPAPRPPIQDEMIDLGGFSIDRYEATLIRIEDGKESVHPYYQRPEDDGLIAVSRPGVFPQGYLSQVEAARFCQNAEKRLCTRKEWMQACKGKRNFLFSFSPDPDAAGCNLGGAHNLGQFFGNDNKKWTYNDFNDPRLNQRPGFLGKTGAHTVCVSDYGAFDMLGNLQEWVSDRRHGKGMFVGAFYSNPWDTAEAHASGNGCEYEIAGHEPAYHDYSIGFRCCKDAK